MINYFYLQTICTKIRGDFVFLQVSVEKQIGMLNKYNCVIDWTRGITENIGKTKSPSKLQCYCLLSGVVFYLLMWRIGSLKFSPFIVTRWMGLYTFFFLQDLGRIYGLCPTPGLERFLPFWRIFFINILHCSPQNYSQPLQVLSAKLKVCVLHLGLSFYV